MYYYTPLVLKEISFKRKYNPLPHFFVDLLSKTCKMIDQLIDLNEYSTKKQRVIRIIILGSLLSFVLMLFTVFLIISVQIGVEVLLITMVIYLMLYIYFVWVSFKTKLFIKVDGNSIVLKFGIRNSSKDVIMWDTIKKVRVGPTYISFYKKSGRRRRYMLGWLPYAKVIEIKDKLVDVFERKGITYEVADFIKFHSNHPK